MNVFQFNVQRRRIVTRYNKIKKSVKIEPPQSELFGFHVNTTSAPKYANSRGSCTPEFRQKIQVVTTGPYAVMITSLVNWIPVFCQN